MPDHADNLIERIEIAGRPYWVDRSDGRIVPLVRGAAVDDGGEDGGDGATGASTGDTGSSAGGSGETGTNTAVTLTQEQVNRIVAREKAAAERNAKKQFDEWLAAQKSEQDKAAMDDAARAKTEAEEARAEAARIKEDAARERLTAKIERKLAAAGVGAGLEPEAAEKAIARAVRLVNVDLDADDDTITAEIDTLKADVPGLFTPTGHTGAGAAGGPPAPSSVTGGGKPGNGTTPQRGIEAGRELARKEREQQQERDPLKVMNVVGARSA